MSSRCPAIRPRGPVPERSARDVARRVLTRVERGGAWATLALDAELDRSGLEDRDRRLVAELVYGVLRHRSRIDRALAAHADLRRTPPQVLLALRLAAYQLLLLDRVPAHAAVDDAVSAARAAGGAKLAGFTNAVLRKLATAGEPPLPAAGRARLEIEYSLPSWILDELAAALGDAELAAAAEGLSRPAALSVRANLRRVSRDEVLAMLEADGATVETSDHAPAGLLVTGLGDPEASPSFRSGMWTVQDIGAQLVGEQAAPGPGARVLDGCAGVGGKSTHLIELGAGAVDAADTSAQKLALCAATARRLGDNGIRTVACDLLDPAAPLADAYDLVVLDAPCTGLGVLRRHPEAKWRLRPEDVDRMADLQAKLLDAMAARVAPGGVFVYSVCTFTRREGPEQITSFLARHPELTLDGELVTTWPHRHRADAFFIARMIRRST